jgi:transposase
MSLQPEPVCPVPEETARVAKAAFPHGNIYMKMRDEIGTIFEDQNFAHLFPACGQPAETPWRLALITIMQFAEGLTDRQAADGVRSRIDWKYALSLELTDSGFDASVLSEFRTRLIAGGSEHLLLETMLTHFRNRGLLKARGRQRTDSTHILAAIRVLGRLECVGETMRHALNSLAVVAPEWLRAQVPSEWFERYGKKFEDYRLPPGRPEREALAETIGADGFLLLNSIYQSPTHAWLYKVPAIDILRRVWLQQFYASDRPAHWRNAADLPPAAILISSPYDIEARYAMKRNITWTGYKVHITETCDNDAPHIITDVETTPATTADFSMTDTIQDELANKDLSPKEHFLDAGYVTAEYLVSSQQQGIDLIGRVPSDNSWQSRIKDGFDISCFTINWDMHTATCPQGKTSRKWIPGKDRHEHEIINIAFAKADCKECPVRSRCTQSTVEPRTLTVRPQIYHNALQAARQRQTTSEFKDLYALRAGIEGTISQGVQAFDLRRSRYIGLAKTHLQHVLTAAAINLVRVGEWLLGTPLARTRLSPFVALVKDCS